MGTMTSPEPSNARLVEALSRLERANSCDAAMQAVALAAQRLHGCMGVLLQHAQNTMPLQAGELPCEFFSSLGGPGIRSSLPLDSSDRGEASWLIVVGGLPAEMQPVGQQGEIVAAAIASVPLTDATGCEAIHFVWNAPVQPGCETLDALRVLSLAAALALRRLHDVERAGHLVERSRLERLESQHRFRNVLSFVRSIVRRTMQSAESPEDFALHLEARIGALSRTQTTLHVAGNSGVEIEDLVRTELRANAIRDEQVDIAGPSIRLRARAAESMALALHELAINSLKYGALSGHGGRTSIQWCTGSNQDTARLQFRWLESGVRIASAAPRHRGFGQELIENTLPYEFDALTQFELTPGGLHCTVDLPLNARTTPMLGPLSTIVA